MSLEPIQHAQGRGSHGIYKTDIGIKHGRIVGIGEETRGSLRMTLGV